MEMRKFPWKIWLLVIVLAVSFSGGAAAAATGQASTAGSGTEPVLRVGLLTGQASVQVSAPSTFVIRDAATGQGLEKYAAHAAVTLTVRNRQILLNGKAIAAKAVTVLPADAKKAPGVELASRAYRGTLLIRLVGNAYTVINEVGMEDYLEGVVPAEMGENWPAEALKAQAVAARTFALYTRSKHAADGYDVCATTHCQLYEGIEAETASTHAAIAATRGEALYYNGQPIYAAFHSSSGGMTAGSDEVWGNSLPYLRPVQDEDTASPHHHWQVRMTAPQVQLKLQAAGYQIGILKKVELTPLVLGAGRTADRSASGRVQLVRFYGTKGEASIPGTKMRQIFGLNSTLFDIRLEIPNVKSIDASMGMTKKEISANLPAVTETGVTGNLHTLTNKNGEILLFDGYGLGHGLGLAQWGARAMAAKNDYRAILSHYYTKVELKKLY